MPHLNSTGPLKRGSLTGRGLGKCLEISPDEALEKLGTGMGTRRKSGGGKGRGKRLKSGIITIKIKNMKIAVPTTNNNLVDAHFGHCEFYTVFTIGNNKNIEKKETLQSPQGCGCKSNIADTLRQMGVEIMLAGNMGQGAVNVLTNHGISVYRGCSGDVNKLVQEFVNGLVQDSGETCHQHGEGHQCDH